jgi:formylglycine-generating enzyme required for sulfatase activity
MAHVDAFCIDRWEASLVEVRASGEASFSPYATVDEHHVRAVSRAGVVPQAYISQTQAKAACAASEKRICTDKEWLRACKGPGATKFPYGAEHKDGACNGESTVAPLSYMPPPKQYPDMENMNNPGLNQIEGTVARTGAYASCTNAFGVFDMVGNLHEWVASDVYGAEFLGGYYRDTTANGDGCDYQTTAHDRFYHDYSTGFRCCKDAR